MTVGSPSKCESAGVCFILKSDSSSTGRKANRSFRGRRDSEVDKALLLGMMHLNVRDLGASDGQTSNASLSLHLPFRQHDRALDGRVADYFLRIRTRVLRLDQRRRSHRPLGILRHARSQGTAELQDHGDDLRRRDARRQLLLFLSLRTGAFLRFRAGGLALFSADRFHPANV